jgi:hypothetical protein
MAQREPSAAQALYGHLPSAERPERQQSGPRLSDALYPRSKERRSSYDELKAAWFERRMEMVGFRRIK